jgi:cell wall-associated NlpC family hydrolase
LLQLLLTSNGLDDFYNRVRLVSTLADRDQRLVADLKASSTRLDLLTKALDGQKGEQLELRKTLATRLEQIDETTAKQQQTLEALDGRVKVVVAQEQARQKAEQERLKAELEAQLAALAAAEYNGDLPQTDNAVTNQLIQTAAAYMGIPYVWGGSKPSAGMDCSGFVRYVFKQHGVTLPHYSGYQAKMGMAVDLADIQQGDVLAFGFPVHHVGIYVGAGLYIDTPGDYVKVHKLTRTDIAAVRRFDVQMRVGAPLFE